MLASMLFVGLCLVVLADAMSERMTRIETMEIQWGHRRVQCHGRQA